MQLELIQGDITRQAVDAIVNAANESLLGGGGVDGAIHKAAGPGLLEECKVLNGCRTGEARITKGYRLPARFVLHTVGPVYKGGNNREAEQLASCYRNCLLLASENKLEIIAFPGISIGIYGYPKLEATKIAISEVKNFKSVNEFPKKIIFVAYDTETYLIYKNALAGL
jgi:O-acetyl-ADP-ribose deacetylase